MCVVLCWVLGLGSSLTVHVCEARGQQMGKTLSRNACEENYHDLGRHCGPVVRLECSGAQDHPFPSATDSTQGQPGVCETPHLTNQKKPNTEKVEE